MRLSHRNDESGVGTSHDFVRGLRRKLMGFHDDERGVTATEYVVLLVLVAAVIIAIVAAFGEQIDRLYNQAVEVLRRDVANQ